MVAETILHELLHACWLAAALPRRASEEAAVNALASVEFKAAPNVAGSFEIGVQALDRFR